MPFPGIARLAITVATYYYSLTHLSEIRFGIPAVVMANDIFADPIATSAPPSNIQIRPDHPVPRVGLDAATAPIETNKFYANFFLGNQTCPTYTHPYSIWWAAGHGPTHSWGMAVTHTEASQRIYGPPGVSGAASYFYSPVRIQSLVLGGTELSNDTRLTIDGITAFSANVHLSRNQTGSASNPDITFPIVQGMGFVTAKYNGATPVIRTGCLFKTVTRSTSDPKPDVAKFTMHLEDGTTWRVYAYRTMGEQLQLDVTSNSLAQGRGPFYGIIQVCKDPGGAERVYDQGAGIYPTGLELKGTASGAQGSYTFAFQREGHTEGNLVMFALPHHQESFDIQTKASMTGVQLQTTTKGVANAVVADSWTMVEPNMPVDIGFAPWTTTRGTVTDFPDDAISAIRKAATKEMSQDIVAQADLDSMYFSGKALCKFAMLVYIANDILHDQALVQKGLVPLKQVFSKFIRNEQKFPLVYERSWGGVVSSATYVTGNEGADFGNTLYNDHHFHYGYFILAAAFIGHVDPSFITESRDYINMMSRDVANPSSADRYYPLWRCFDWYHGHSWATGLFASVDGKNQESSSEDMMHAYALKMWGQVSGNRSLEDRGNLQLAIMSRSLPLYYLYKNDNRVQPPQFIGNKVAGILFENKCAHTTFFGNNIEYIQGIHIIPILSCTPYVRSADFVSEEWDTYFSRGRIDAVQGGWKGLIYSSYASVNPEAAWQFFNASDFKMEWIDPGASLTWYLTYCAALRTV